MRRLKIQDGGISPHFITWTITEWLPVFISDKYCRVITDSFSYCRKEKGLLVHSYVIMPTHVHAIVSAREGNDLSAIIRDSRKYTSKEIVKLLQEDGSKLFDWMFRNAAQKAGRPGVAHKVWIEDSHPETLEEEKFFMQKFNYLHNNPVAKGLVSLPEHWYYSSAAAYVNGASEPLEVDLLF